MQRPAEVDGPQAEDNDILAAATNSLLRRINDAPDVGCPNCGGGCGEDDESSSDEEI
jgi:hypothetical protein